MSVESNIKACQEVVENPCSGLLHSIEPKARSLGGFTVRRALPALHCQSIGPWVFFDHMGPTEFKPGQGVDVRPHPHIGLATVTYLFEGEIFHRDSLGHKQAITPGDINLMVAGKGIVHSERERPQIHQQPHRVNGLQLWLGLPVADEECDPNFYHYPAQSIPTTTVHDVPVRVMMGEAYGVSSPVKTFAQTLYLEARLKKGQSLTLPMSPEIGVYVVEGGLKAKDSPLKEGTLSVFDGSLKIQLTAVRDSLIAVIGGEPLGPRYVIWNFVSSSLDKIEQAKQKWLDGKFELIPEDHDDYIPLPGDSKI